VGIWSTCRWWRSCSSKRLARSCDPRVLLHGATGGQAPQADVFEAGCEDATGEDARQVRGERLVVGLCADAPLVHPGVVEQRGLVAGDPYHAKYAGQQGNDRVADGRDAVGEQCALVRCRHRCDQVHPAVAAFVQQVRRRVFLHGRSVVPFSSSWASMRMVWPPMMWPTNRLPLSSLSYSSITGSTDTSDDVRRWIRSAS
jgi:hypothetical protein